MPVSPDFKYYRNVSDLIAKQRKPPTLPETGWHTIGNTEEYGIAFQNGYSNATGITHAIPAAHYLSEDGEVRSRGRIAIGTIGQVMYTLPAEFRPEYTDTFLCEIEDTDGKKGLGFVTVWANGDVVFDGPMDAATVSGVGSYDGGSP